MRRAEQEVRRRKKIEVIAIHSSPGFYTTQDCDITCFTIYHFSYRMALQKDAKSKKKVDESAPPATVAAPSMNKEDVEMLEITLGMLRCSVCRDRFKEVALCRCFHLFCKECIDENIRNRNRKCPACGEKFGQDDVKTIYFTH